MKNLLVLLFFLTVGSLAQSQTTWQVCVEDPPSTTCPGKTGTFTPGNLVIQQGDMIEFTTTMVLLSGYSGTLHNIEFLGSPANNVDLLVSADIFNQVTSVTTPPFNTPGVFPMECTNFNHCILSEYPCTGYTVTVLGSSCPAQADFTTTPDTIVCEGEILDFTNNSTGAVSYEWQLSGFTFATTTDATLSFGSMGTYEVSLIAYDGSSCYDTMSVTIDVDPASDAGLDDSLAFCNIDDSIDLNTLVTGDTGGLWQENTSSGQFNPTSAVFNYLNLPSSLYEFEYVVPGIGVCPNDTAEFKIFINQEPGLTLNLGASPIATSDSLSVDFVPNGILPGAQFLWDFCDGNLATDTTSFYYQWTSPGNYCVCVTVNNLNNCVETFCDSSISVFDDSGIPQLELHVEELKIYPNPTSQFINIDLSRYSGTYTLYINDASAKEVLRQSVNGGHVIQIDLMNLPAGVYTASISSTDFLATAQFIVD